MFTNFCTPIRFGGIFEVIEIGKLEEFHNNKNIVIKVRGCRKRMQDGNKVYNYDSIYIKAWSKAAMYVDDNMSIGDIIDVQGEIRGNTPNIDFRSVKFEILTPTDEEMEQFNG